MKRRALSRQRVPSRKVQSGRAEMASDVMRNGDPGSTRSGSRRALQDPPERYRVPASGRPDEQLRNALHQIDALLEHNARLEHRVASLTREVARARAFAFHDELTGLPNRRLLLDHFEQAAAKAQREARQFALLFIDLDGFKCVNDEFGHVAGDRVLQKAAARLKACVRECETACRYGGDEFVVLLTELDGQRALSAAAGRINEQLSRTYVLDAGIVRLTASIGMAVYPDDGRKWADLIRVSDLSMLGQKRCRLSLPELR